MVAFDASRDAAAAWPQLHVGFVGTPAASDGRWLGFDAGADSVGAPVFDAAGRLAGVVLPAGRGGRLRFSGVTPLRAWLEVVDVAASPLPAPRIGVDEVYERGLRSALQLIALR